MSVDVIGDLTRLFRIGKKMAQGDMSVDEFLGGGDSQQDAAPAADAPKCKKTPGCIDPPGHKGGCCIDATPADET